MNDIFEIIILNVGMLMFSFVLSAKTTNPSVQIF